VSQTQDKWVVQLAKPEFEKIAGHNQNKKENMFSYSSIQLSFFRICLAT